MPKHLTVEQQQRYARDGFVAPIDIFTADEITDIRAEIEAAESRWPNALDGAGRNNGHLALPVLDRIIHDSRILDAVEDVIGGDILVAGSTLFIKEPSSGGFISWHQDARYAGMEPHDWVTGWVAISNVTEENGCMRMIPGSHIDPLRDHGRRSRRRAPSCERVPLDGVVGHVPRDESRQGVRRLRHR